MGNKTQAELAELGMSESDMFDRQQKVNAILGRGEVLEPSADIVQVKSDGSKFLALIPADKIQAIFAGDGLARITEEIKRLAMEDPAAGDPTERMKTVKGRKEITHLGAMVVSSKTYLDGLGKDLVADLKDLPRKIDANRKTMRDELDALADAIKAPVVADKNRVDAHEARLQTIREMPLRVQAGTSADVAAMIDTLFGMPMGAEAWDEFAGDASAVKDRTAEVLNEAYLTKKQAEDNAVELERLRKESAERERKDAEDRRIQAAADKARADAEARHERERLEAEQKAERERQAALGREAEAVRAAELAKQRAAESENLLAKLKAENLYREIREYVSAELVEVGGAQIQRRFELGFGAASDALARMEADGIVGPSVDGKRKVVRAEGPAPIQQPAPTPEAVKTEPSADHRKQFNREAMEDIKTAIEAAFPMTANIEGQSWGPMAKALATAIIKGQIRHVTIEYGA